MVVWPSIQDIKAIVFDFDGVFTDNKVYVSQDGQEMVRCDRGDGLGMDFLRLAVEEGVLTNDVFILSKEKNQVVKARADKMNIPCIHGVDDKLSYLAQHMQEKHGEKDLSKLVYLGNDLNDLSVILRVGFSVVPRDSHPVVAEIASSVLPADGGDGFVRMFVEKLLGIDNMSAEEIDERIYHSRDWH